MLYLARKGNSQIYLTNSGQMDEFLEKGCDIYSEDKDGKQSLIATPDQGYLIEKPVYPEEYTIRIK